MVRITDIVYEDVVYLEEWISFVKGSALELSQITKKDQGASFFSISSAFERDFARPYLTPLRFLENGVVRGVVVSTLTQAVIAAVIVAPLVDHILVDAEQKINLKFDFREDLLIHMGIHLSDIQKQAIRQESHGNISRVLRAVLMPNKIIDYKPNDLTVEAVWNLLSVRLNGFSGKTIAIIGCGNIGFKLALKLVESGADVTIFRRDDKKALLMADSINIAKPVSCLASARNVKSAMEASASCDVLIGASSGNEAVITWSMIEQMPKTSFIVDIGKGNIDHSTVKKALEDGIEVMRGDITTSLYGFISSVQQMKDLVTNKMGRIETSSNTSIVSGGLLGKDGDVIVDNVNCPTVIYGVADGLGNLKIDLNSDDQKIVNELKVSFKLK